MLTCCYGKTGIYRFRIYKIVIKWLSVLWLLLFLICVTSDKHFMNATEKMGSEYSIHKNRTVSPCDEGMTLRIRNNFRPLHFHQVHGDNIKLSKNATVAWRSEGFCKGIAFSNRPIMVCEPVYIKFLEISSNWSGALRIGFTTNDPVTMKSKLPRYACPDLTAFNGHWAKAIAERLAKKDSVLYYYVDHNGDVHYGIDSEEHGIFFGGVCTSGKLWAILDIYGNTVAVEFVDPSTMNPESVSELPNNSVIGLRSKEQACNPDASSVLNLNLSISFHKTHGKNSFLRRNGTVVSRKPGFQSLAYAFTERPLIIGEKVVVKVLETDTFSKGILIYGITSCNPSTLDPDELPENSDDLLDRPEYWVVRQDSNLYKNGDFIIYSINAEGEVTVMKNYDYNSAIFHVDPTQPLWLFFNVVGCITEMMLMGTSCASADDISKAFENMHVSLPVKDAGVPGPSSQQTFTECVICYEEPVNCALYRCGHMCMCYSCALKMWKPSASVHCPICREAIQDVIKIYR